MNYTTENAQELIEEWDYHNRRHNCYYEQSDDAGPYEECPAEHATLRAFMMSKGFPVSYKNDWVLGRELNEPNYRLKSEAIYGPRRVNSLSTRLKESIERLESKGHAVEKIETPEEQEAFDTAWKTPLRDRYKQVLTDNTDAVLRNRAERARNDGQSAGSNEVDPGHHEYYKSRLDSIESVLVNVVRKLDWIQERLGELAPVVTDDDYNWYDDL